MHAHNARVSGECGKVRTIIYLRPTFSEREAKLRTSFACGHILDVLGQSLELGINGIRAGLFLQALNGLVACEQNKTHEYDRNEQFEGGRFLARLSYSGFHHLSKAI